MTHPVFLIYQLGFEQEVWVSRHHHHVLQLWEEEEEECSETEGGGETSAPALPRVPSH